MTEKEFIIEMLCCIPKELLEKRKRNSIAVPNWLKKTEMDYVVEALGKYDDKYYRKIREDMLKNVK